MTKKTQDLKPDTVLKNYWNNNEQFADLFNAILFGGEQVISPDELEDADTEESSILEHREYAESIKASRDSIKICKKSLTHGVEFVMLGLESQEHIHYAMPMRVMGYDYGTYKKQYDSNAKKYQTKNGMTDDEYLSRMKQADRFTPVITVVVYYGDNPWDGATTLHGMLNIPDKMKPFVNDYKMLLVEARQNDLIFHNMTNIAFFDMLKVVLDKSITKNEAKEKVIKYAIEHNVDKTVVMTVAGATNRKIDYHALSKKGDVTMCTLFDEIEKEGMIKGIQALIESLQEMEIPYNKTQNQLMVKFSLSEDTAQEYMDKFWK
ncbi:transposase [bacterium 1xD42-87]|nr:transposase [bacterium 1xD42-87]